MTVPGGSAVRSRWERDDCLRAPESRPDPDCARGDRDPDRRRERRDEDEDRGRQDGGLQPEDDDPGSDPGGA